LEDQGVNQGYKLAAQNYVGDQDYWTVPLSTIGGIAGKYGDAEITPEQMAYYDQIWKVSATEIQNHIQNYNTTGNFYLTCIELCLSKGSG